jgi:hypothetical protein
MADYSEKKHKEAAISWHPAAKFPWIQQGTELIIFLTTADNTAGNLWPH